MHPPVVSGTNQKEEEEEASSSSPKQIMHSTNILEHTLISLKCLVNEHAFINLVPLNKKSNPQ